MLEKLSEKDQKTVKMGGLAVLALALAFGVYQGYNFREKQTKESKILDNDLKTLNMSSSAHKNLMAAVPYFQMPDEESIQKTKFRSSLNQLFEQMRISMDPLVEVAAGNSIRPPVGYGTLSLKTSSKGTVSFQNILYLLAALKENPYLVGIEELKITCDQQNPQLANLSIVLATFTNNKNNNKRAK
ncbi:MAG: hypothetical protein JXA96_03200 [Sedimentisphaerales bacterium]|nr:hypothetical protein [Sedimentisphaerales bacterium]